MYKRDAKTSFILQYMKDQVHSKTLKLSYTKLIAVK